MTDKNFLGIPIKGTINNSYDRAVSQRPDSDLTDAITRLVAFDNFTAIRWIQYTPYFNDGDPCVFGINGCSFYLGDDPIFEEVYDEYDNPGCIDLPRTDRYVENESEEMTKKLDELVGRRSNVKYDWSTHPSTRTGGDVWTLEPKNPEMIEAVQEVCNMISSGAFNIFLLRTFGDHTTVTLRKDRIDLSEYSHD